MIGEYPDRDSNPDGPKATRSFKALAGSAQRRSGASADFAIGACR